MPTIITSRTRNLYLRPPTGPWAVNLDSPQAVGLKLWYPMLDGGGPPKPVVGGANLGESATKPLWRAFPGPSGDSAFGMGRRYNGASSYDSGPWFTTIDGNSKPNQCFTVAMWAACNTQATQAGLFSLSNSPAATFAVSGSIPVLINVGKTAGKLTYLIGDAAYVDGTRAIANGRPFQFALTCDTTVATPVFSGYVDGLLDSTDTTHGFGSTDNVALFFLGSGFPVQMDGWVGDFRGYLRVLSAAEAFALYDPRTRWDLYYPIGRRTTSFHGAGSGTFTFTMSGGVVLSGSANSPPFTASATGSGGAVLGGATSPPFATSMTGSGGVVLAGSASTPPFAATKTMAGGVALSGSASSPSFTATYTMTGGEVLSGTSAAPSFTASYAPSGGVVLGGAAVESWTTTWTMAGGLVTSGAATVSWTTTWLMTGGLLVGGSAASPSFTATVSVAGGMVLGGAATAQQSGNSSYTMAGGAVLGGSSPGSFTASLTGSGGVVLGGSAANPAFAATNTMAGGVILGGAAVVTFGATFTATMSGGAVLGGAAGLLWSATYGMTGGLIAGGDATTAFVSGAPTPFIAVGAFTLTPRALTASIADRSVSVSITPRTLSATLTE